MATKKSLIEDSQSCLNKAKDGEPLFVLRAQDRLAQSTLYAWIEQAESLMDSGKGSQALRSKILEAREVWRAMSAWPFKKIPD